MKKSAALQLFRFLVPVFLVTLAQAYDSPDFDTEIFDADGLFLEDSERDSLLEALAAVASNFSSSSRVDDDLREKAVALALRISPLHYNSRQAHESLVRGEKPSPTAYFDDLSTVSEALWRAATSLLDPPVEPNAAKLAPYLMEISLIIHPIPPEERVQAFGRAGRKSLHWDRFVILQPGIEASSTRAEYLLKEGIELAKTRGSSPPGSPKRVAKNPPQPDRAPMEPIHRSLLYTGHPVPGRSQCLTGVFSVTLRSLESAEEAARFPEVEAGATSGFPRLPVTVHPESFPLVELDLRGSLIEERGWSWPEGAVAELKFTGPDFPDPGDTGISSALPAIVLLDAAFTGREIQETFVLCGELDESSGTISLEGSVEEIVASAALRERPYLLLPAAGGEALQLYIEFSKDLSVLFPIESIVYATVEDILTFATSPVSPELAEASAAFEEIEMVSSRMSLVDLAKNAKVQERLEAILERYPRHFSAEAMLEFGTGGETSTMTSASTAPDETLATIDALVEPYLALKDDGADVNNLRYELEETDLGLSRQRMTISLELRNYLSRAEDMLDAAEAYLNLSNKQTSLGNQRLRELRDAISALEEERNRLK